MEKYFETDGQRLFYEVTGPEDGQPVVLMHGWGCTHDTLRSIERVLSPTMRVYSVDFPGHGRSPEPNGVWGVYEYTDLIEKWLDAEGIVNPVILGHSFGGRVAILMASRRQVKKVVLVDAAGVRTPRKSRKGLWKTTKIYTFKAGKHLMRILLGKKRSEKPIERWRLIFASEDYRNLTPTMRPTFNKVISEDLQHVMPSIKAPTLLIWGADDTATPLSDAQIMEKLIPDAGLVSFPGCGHYSFLDNPGQFAAVLRSFMKD